MAEVAHDTAADDPLWHLLGGTRLSTLARAQYLRERSPGAVDALSRAFLGDRDPHCPELF